jgi:hypothetical protein
MTRGRSLLIVAPLIALLSGCQALSGPLRYGFLEGGTALICAAAEPGEAVLIGDFLTAPGAEVRIDAVELVDAQGLELEGAWLLPPDGGVGAVRLPPPPEVPWGERVDAVGARIAPGEDHALAFLVRRTGAEVGTAESVAITYTVGVGTFRKTGAVSMVLEDTCL